MANDEDDIASAKRWGRALKWVRQNRAGITQEKAAERLGWESGQAYAKYEQGKAPAIFRPETQKRIALALGVTHEQLLLAFEQMEFDDGSAAISPASAMREPATAAFQVPMSTRVRLDDTHALSFDLKRADAAIDLSWAFTPDAGALRVAGSQLRPLADHGDALIYDRSRFPSPGKLCVVELKTGQAYAYRFERLDRPLPGERGGAVLFCSQTEPAAEVQFNMEAVKGVYAVRCRIDD